MEALNVKGRSCVAAGSRAVARSRPQMRWYCPRRTQRLTPMRTHMPLQANPVAAKADESDVVELAVASDADLLNPDEETAQPKMLVPAFTTGPRSTQLATTGSPNSQLQTAAMRGLQAENSMLGAKLTVQSKEIQESKQLIRQQQAELLVLRQQLILQKGESRSLRVALQEAQEALSLKESQLGSLSGLLLEGSKERNQLRAQLMAAQAESEAAADHLSNIAEDLMVLKTVMDSADDLGDLGALLKADEAYEEDDTDHQPQSQLKSQASRGSDEDDAEITFSFPSNGSAGSRSSTSTAVSGNGNGNGNGRSNNGSSSGWMGGNLLQTFGIGTKPKQEQQPVSSKSNGASAVAAAAATAAAAAGRPSAAKAANKSSSSQSAAADEDDEQALTMLSKLVELGRALVGDASKDLEVVQKTASRPAGDSASSADDL